MHLVCVPLLESLSNNIKKNIAFYDFDYDYIKRHNIILKDKKENMKNT